MQQYLFESAHIGWLLAQQIFFGVVEQHFEGLDLMAFVGLGVAEIADDALVAAGGFEADEVEQFSAVLLAALALRVLELLCHLLFYTWMYILYWSIE